MFMKTLQEKALLKKRSFPDCKLQTELILNARTFEDFDNAVTAPLWGYENAKDYWQSCSSNQFIKAITKPTLIINALDDSFLSESCYPFNQAKNNTFVQLETPKYGGHVGFNTSVLSQENSWCEKRILDFIRHII